MKSIKFLIFLFTVSLQFSFSQESNVFKDINDQLWSNFTKAFETRDSNLFSSLHTKDMIRLNGDNKSIRLLDDYLIRNKRHWQNKAIKETISLRFTERFYKDNLASERGIFKFTTNLGNEDEKSYYGKFHVILKKENNTWKILMDYDSSEENTINEESYQKAIAIDNYSKFKKNPVD